MTYKATVNCSGCQAVMKGGTHKGHSENCRERFTKLLQAMKGPRIEREMNIIQEAA